MNFLNKTDEEILAIAEPIMENLVQGSNELNYQKFSRDFSQVMFNSVPEEEFKRQMAELHPVTGLIVNKREFIRCIRRDSGVTVLWVGYFEKIKGEVLAQISLDEEDGEMKVFGALVN